MSIVRRFKCLTCKTVIRVLVKEGMKSLDGVQCLQCEKKNKEAKTWNRIKKKSNRKDEFPREENDWFGKMADHDKRIKKGGGGS